MNSFQKTKILCTLGPASWDESVLKAMINDGMTIARINGAYADVDELKRVAKSIRKFSDKVALMLDIKGSEVRLNKFEFPIPVKVGDEVAIGYDEKDTLYPITYPDLYKDLKKGNMLRLDDGKVTLKVQKIEKKKILTKVVQGNEILPGKTINTPGIPLSNPPITPRDIEQIKFAIKDNWDYIAASFVRYADDIEEVKKHTGNSIIKIMAKIEDEQGTSNIDEIIDACDGIIIARGDMGVEMPYEKVPAIQKEMVTKCLLKAKPAIVATHMLESMIENPNATRAEINDVANAIFDGADCVWLSAETSTGKYPREAVHTLKRISLEAEKHIQPEILYGNPDINPITVALARGVIDIVESLSIDKIVVATGTGKTARIISSFKPRQPIIALTSNETYMRQLQGTWGVTPTVLETEIKDRDRGIKRIAKKVIDDKLVKPNDLILVIRGTTPITKKTNSLEIGIANELTD
ncbi:pyruvate kinase [Candidatus Dojkabacteria bacterium]|nr:pyruvate kinase [Candidatus Dojkabacteria bacterium]